MNKNVYLNKTNVDMRVPVELIVFPGVIRAQSVQKILISVSASSNEFAIRDFYRVVR